MGCASSKGMQMPEEGWNASFLRSISMPLNNNPAMQADNQHLVALISSTYEIFKLESSDYLPFIKRKSKGEQIKDPSANSIKYSAEIASSDSLPRKVSPQDDQFANASQVGKKARHSRDQSTEVCEQPEIINTWELMEGLEEDSSRTNPTSAEKSAQYGRSLSLSALHSLRKIDAVLRGESKHAGRFLKVIQNVKNNLIQRSSVDPCQKQEKTEIKHSQDLSNPLVLPPTSDSEETRICLTDFEILSSIEIALEQFSEDDWFSLRSVDSDKACSSDTDSSSESNYDPSGLDRENPASENKGSLSIDAAFSSEEHKTHQNRNAQPADEPVEINSSLATASKMQDQEQIPGKIDPLEGFQWLCPPGGEDRVVLYCTSLRGIRKTFEDCSTLQMILRSFCVRIDERDVSMDLQYRKELADLVGNLAPVPRLFMKGRYVGGAEEVRQLHEDRKLKRLFEGIPKDASQAICNGCGGMRFIPCLDCSGSCKRINEEREVTRCSDCNENGLIRCPICC